MILNDYTMMLPENFHTSTVNSDFDDLTIDVLYSVPFGEEKGILQVVHGMAEYKERYIPFMKYMSDHGYVCVIHDHRGHGKSIRHDDDLGYMYTGGYKALVADTLLVTKYIKSLNPSLPVFLLGHSMGAAVVRSYIKKYDDEINGLIVCGNPGKSSALSAARLLVGIIGVLKGDRYRSRFINRLIFSGYSKKIEGAESSYSWLCSDEEVVNAYYNDPGCGFVFTLNGFAGLFGVISDSYNIKDRLLKNPDLPIFFISGADDPCMISKNKFYKAVDALKKAGYKNIAGKLYDGMRHEILNEKEKSTVWKDVLNHVDGWL